MPAGTTLGVLSIGSKVCTSLIHSNNSETKLSDGGRSIQPAKSPREQLKTLLDEVSRTLPSESQQTLDSVVPINAHHSKSSESPAPKRKTRVGIKSARGNESATADSSPTLPKSVEHSPKIKRTSHSKDDRHESHSESHTRKRTKPTRTLSAGSVGETEPDSATSESTLSLDPIQEESTESKRKVPGSRNKPPRFLPLETVEARKKMTQTHPESARNIYGKGSARRRKSMGPDDPANFCQPKSARKEPRRGQTVEPRNSSPLSPSSGSESAHHGGSQTPTPPKSVENRVSREFTVDKEKEKETKKEKDVSSREEKIPERRDEGGATERIERPHSDDRANVRRAKSDSTINTSKVNKDGARRPPLSHKPRFHDLKKTSESPLNRNTGLTSDSSDSLTTVPVIKTETEKEDLVYRVENGRLNLVWAKYEAIMDLIVNTDFNLGSTFSSLLTHQNHTSFLYFYTRIRCSLQATRY